MEFQEINLSEKSIKYYKIGKGKPIVYIHSFEGIMITQPIRELSENFEIYFPVIPGFHKTKTIETSDSVSQITEILIEFIQKISNDKVDLIGYSLGSYIASQIVIKKPDIIDQLILMSPLGIDFENEKNNLNNNNYENTVYNFPEKYNAIVNHEDLLDKTKISLYSIPNSNKDFLNQLTKIKNLTLILMGNNDSIVSSESAQIIKEYIEHSYLIYIYDAGHGIGIDQPERVASLMSDFLTRGQAFIVNWTGRDNKDAPTRELKSN